MNIEKILPLTVLFVCVLEMYKTSIFFGFLGTVAYIIICLKLQKTKK